MGAMAADPGDPLAHLREARNAVLWRLERADDDVRTAVERRQSHAKVLAELDGLIEKHFSATSVASDKSVLDSVIGSGSFSRRTRILLSGTADVEVGSTREGIHRILDSEDRSFETLEIVQGVQRLGVDSTPATTRSLLSKMAESGQIHRVRRGLYRRAGHSAAAVSTDGRWAPLWPMSVPSDPDDSDRPEPTAEFAEMDRDARVDHEAEQADREEISS